MLYCGVTATRAINPSCDPSSPIALLYLLSSVSISSELWSPMQQVLARKGVSLLLALTYSNAEAKEV